MYRGLWAGASATIAIVVTYLVTRAQTNGHPWELDALLAIVVVILSCLLVYTLVALAVTLWNYLFAVEVLPGEWHFRFWPHQQVTQVSGIRVRAREHAGLVKVKCRARFGEEEVASTAEFPTGSHAVYTPTFPQEKVRLKIDPSEGDAVRLVVNAWPSWWRGGPSERVQTVKTGVTDHRPAPVAVNPEQVREAIARIDPLVVEAQAILEACGRPREKMTGADPMYFQEECTPKINKFASDADVVIQEVAPEYIGTQHR